MSGRPHYPTSVPVLGAAPTPEDDRVVTYGRAAGLYALRPDGIELGPLGIDAVNPLQSVPLHTYGDSNHGVSLNQNSTTVGQQLARLFAMPLFEGAVGGTQALDVPVSMLFGGSLDRAVTAPAILKDSYALPVPFRGVVLIGAGTNDVAQHGDDPLMVTRVRNALRTAIRIAQAASKVAPTDASLAYSAGWNTGANIFAVGGTAKATTTTGSYVDVTFTGDTVTLLSAGLLGAGGPQVSATEAGSARGSWDLSNLGPSDAASTKLGYVPLVPLTVSGLGAGSHTIRFTKTTSASEFDVLAVLVQSTAPAQVLLLDQPGVADPWSSYDLAKTGVSYYGNGSDAGLASVNTVLADLATEFGATVSFVPVTEEFDKATMLAQPYGAHFNDHGVAHAANKVVQALLPVGWRDGVQVIAAEGAPTPGLTGFKAVYRAASVTASDGEFVLADATAAAVTITLPKPWPDRKVGIKKLDATANTVTVATYGGLIDGAATKVLTLRYEAVECISDGTNWYIIRRYLSSPVSATLVDAKGDLLLGTADNTIARLAVGANETLLVADSSQATGVRWGSPTTLSASGLTGATSASRYVGATASGAPGSGTFAIGDYVIARDGHVFICTVAGSPGTWVDAAAGGGGGGGIAPTLLDAKGDLIVASANDTPVRLAVGADGRVLVADSTQATGLAWVPRLAPTLVDAKGDLLTATANDTPARLGVGSNGQVLTADSTQATGLRWSDRVQVEKTFSFPGQATTGVRALRWYADEGYTFVKARVSCGGAPAGSGVIADVLKNGSSIFTSGNRPQCASGTQTGTSTTFATTTMAQDDYLTISIAQVGSVAPGTDVTVQVYMVKT